MPSVYILIIDHSGVVRVGECKGEILTEGLFSVDISCTATLQEKLVLQIGGTRKYFKVEGGKL